MTTWQHNAEDRALRERGRLAFLAGWSGDVLYGLRVLAKNPGFTTVAVLTLALCIGANTAIFSIINAVMFKSLPVRDPQHLMLLKWTVRGTLKSHSFSSYGDCSNRSGGANPHGCSLSKPFLEEVRQHGPFSSLAEFAGGGSITVSGNVAVHQATGQYVSGDYFQALGVGPAAGRVFVPADDAPGARPRVRLIAAASLAVAALRASERRWPSRRRDGRPDPTGARSDPARPAHLLRG